MISHTSLIDISDIHKHTQNNKIKHEIGGFFTQTNNTLTFYKTSESVPQNKNRMFVNLPNQGMIWHTHPQNVGFWPSFEDINRHNPKHILFSKYGVWIFNNNPLKNNQNKVNQMRQSYRPFHTFLEKTTQMKGGWDARQVQEKIQLFIGTMYKTYGFKIDFIPNWYGKKVLKNTNIIKHI